MSVTVLVLQQLLVLGKVVIVLTVVSSTTSAITTTGVFVVTMATGEVVASGVVGFLERFFARLVQ